MSGAFATFMFVSEVFGCVERDCCLLFHWFKIMTDGVFHISSFCRAAFLTAGRQDFWHSPLVVENTDLLGSALLNRLLRHTEHV